MNENRKYLGNGIYIYFNGFSFEISVNSNFNEPVVILQDTVIDELIAFYSRFKNKDNE